MYIYICVLTHIGAGMFLCVHIHAYMYIYIHMRVYIHIQMCVYLYEKTFVMTLGTLEVLFRASGTTGSLGLQVDVEVLRPLSGRRA